MCACSLRVHVHNTCMTGMVWHLFWKVSICHVHTMAHIPCMQWLDQVRYHQHHTVVTIIICTCKHQVHVPRLDLED